FGIASLPINNLPSGHPEFLFTNKKQELFSILVPLLRKMAQWDATYNHPIYALELMNEPENMPILILPEFFKGLKSWLLDLATIVHQETPFKVTLGSHSIVDMQRWWHDLPIDLWQFHFYSYMTSEHDHTPLDLDRGAINIHGPIICGELDPHFLG